MAVCMGTEHATASAHDSNSASNGSTERSTQRTSWPARTNAPAGDATCNG